MNHLTADDAERWAAGLLDEADASALEAHAEVCASCEAMLQREAAVELRLAQLVRVEARPKASPAKYRWALVAAPLAMALGFLLVFNSDAPRNGSRADAGSHYEAADLTHFAGEQPPPEAFEARAPFQL